jgi:hypothetical protein
MKRSTVTPPPMDVDIGQLDEEHLNQLARRWQLQAELKTWLGRAQSVGFGEEPVRPQGTMGARPDAAAAIDGVAAQRMLRRAVVALLNKHARILWAVLTETNVRCRPCAPGAGAALRIESATRPQQIRSRCRRDTPISPQVRPAAGEHGSPRR